MFCVCSDDVKWREYGAPRPLYTWIETWYASIRKVGHNLIGLTEVRRSLQLLHRLVSSVIATFVNSSHHCISSIHISWKFFNLRNTSIWGYIQVGKNNPVYKTRWPGTVSMLGQLIWDSVWGQHPLFTKTPCTWVITFYLRRIGERLRIQNKIRGCFDIWDNLLGCPRACPLERKWREQQ